MEKLTCEKCGKQISRNQSAVSNWAVIKNQMTCGECQGLTDSPTSIKSFGPSGKTAMQVNIKSAAATLGSIKTEKKAASARENGKKGGRPRGINLSTLIDRYGANGVIRIDAGNGSAGPAWIEWDKEIAKEIGKVKMLPVSGTSKAYEDDDKDSTIEHEAKYVIPDYSYDDNTMYASAWIEDDNRNAPYQATNPYRYRLIF